MTRPVWRPSWTVLGIAAVLVVLYATLLAGCVVHAASPAGAETKPPDIGD